MLKRLYARILIAANVAAVAAVLFGGAFMPESVYTFMFAGIGLAVVTVILRQILMKCPKCGKCAAPPQWSKNKTIHCPHCGEPFEYDK